MTNTSKNILLLTSTYPFGIGEAFIEPEIVSLSEKNNLFIMPTYPRGKHKITYIHNQNTTYINEKLLSITSIITALFFIIQHPKRFYTLLKLCKYKNIKKTIRNLVLIPKALKISNIINKNKININFCYAHWLSAPMQLALLINYLTNIPFGTTGHRFDLVDNNNFKQKFQKASFIRLISHYSKELIPSEIYNTFSDKIHVIYMGINIPNNHNKKNETNKIKGVSIGNLIEVKGHTYLINAIKILKDCGIIIYLDIYGDGYLKKQLQEETHNLGINDQVTFMGNVIHNKLMEQLTSNCYNFCCLPSIDLGNHLHEGIPVAILESMAHKIPCISTNTGSIPELIEHQKTGLLVNDKDSKSLAEAIKNIIENQTMSDTIRDNAYNLVNTKFNSKINNDILCNLIMNEAKKMNII